MIGSNQLSTQELCRRGAFYFYNRLIRLTRGNNLQDDPHLLKYCAHAMDLARTIITAPSGSLTDSVVDSAYRRLVIAYVEVSSEV